MKNLTIADQKVFFNSSEVMKDIKDNSIDLIITSPPYWNPHRSGSSHYRNYPWQGSD